MKYLIYKVTNTINGKIYIGCHQTDNIDDGYMGSGTALLRSIKKYGVSNFKKEILEECSSEDEMFLSESKYVDEDFVKRGDTYNIKTGGNGGFGYINATGKNIYGSNGMKGHGFENLVHGNGELVSLLKQRGTFDQYRKNMSESLKRGYATGELTPTFLGKTHTEEAKRRIGRNSAIHQTGEKNSQYGTKWIYNLDLEESKRVPSETSLPEGWQYGRVQNFEVFKSLAKDIECEPHELHSLMKRELSRLSNVRNRTVSISNKRPVNNKEKLINRKMATQDKERELLAKKQKLTDWHEIYRTVGWEGFKKQTGYDKTKQNLVMQFAKHVDEFVPQNGKKRGDSLIVT